MPVDVLIAADSPAGAVAPAGREAPSRPARGFVHLKTRADFLRVAKGARFHSAAFSLQAAPNGSALDTPARFGFTVTKKTAGAVQRNRIRRRLREAVRANVLAAKPGHDYVLVARPEALVMPFGQLTEELIRALGSVHARRGGRRRDPSRATAMSVRPADLGAISQGEATGPDQDRLDQDRLGQDRLGKDQ